MDRRTFISLAGVTVTELLRTPLAQAAARVSPRSNWERFARTFVTQDGRVIDTGNQGITHTEGLGVALLAAQAAGDRDRFERIWGFCQKLLRPDGLYSWKYVPGHGIADPNNATDGDLYIAWALHEAASKWRDTQLAAAALRGAKAVRTHCLRPYRDGVMLLPGVQGFTPFDPHRGEELVVNPSYLLWPAFTALSRIDPDPAWERLTSTGLSLLANARFGPHHLPADWLLLADPVIPWPARPARFGYEAIRVPMFLAWGHHFDHPALKACAQYLRSLRFPAWCALNGKGHAGYQASSGEQAIARLARSAALGMRFHLPEAQGDYYSSSLTLLVGLAAHTLGYVH